MTEVALKPRSEEDRLRYILQAIADFPYTGKLAAQRMQLLAKGALATTDTEPGGWPPPFELMKLQARKLYGNWVDIYPAQLEQMIRSGCAIRAVTFSDS